MLLVVCQLSCDVIDYEDSWSWLVRFDPSIVTVKQSSIVSQIVSSPVLVVLSELVLLDLVNKSFVRHW